MDEFATLKKLILLDIISFGVFGIIMASGGIAKPIVFAISVGVLLILLTITLVYIEIELKDTVEIED